MNKDDAKDSQRRLVAERFDKEAKDYLKKHSGCSSIAHSSAIRRQRVRELLDKRGKGKVLDIGCGPGMMAEDLVGKGFEFFGVDISKEMIEQCKKKFGHIGAAHFSQGSIEKLEFPDSFFDAVTCMGVMEYLDDDDIAIKEMARVLRPGGVMIVTLPNKSSPYRIWHRLCRGAVNLINKITEYGTGETIVRREFTSKGYCRLLESRRLNVTDLVYYNFNLVFYPLDELFPYLEALLTRRLEFLYRSRLGWLGTGFIIMAKKG